MGARAPDCGTQHRSRNHRTQRLEARRPWVSDVSATCAAKSTRRRRARGGGSREDRGDHPRQRAAQVGHDRGGRTFRRSLTSSSEAAIQPARTRIHPRRLRVVQANPGWGRVREWYTEATGMVGMCCFDASRQGDARSPRAAGGRVSAVFLSHGRGGDGRLLEERRSPTCARCSKTFDARRRCWLRVLSRREIRGRSHRTPTRAPEREREAHRVDYERAGLRRSVRSPRPGTRSTAPRRPLRRLGLGTYTMEDPAMQDVAGATLSAPSTN